MQLNNPNSSAKNTSEMRVLLRSLNPQRAGVVYALALIMIVFQILTVSKGLPGFLGVANIDNLLDEISIDGLLAVGMTILLITGNFDLSVGYNAGLCAGVGMQIANRSGPLLGLLAAVATGMIIGLANGLLVQKLGVNSFVVTLGMAAICQSGLLIVSNTLPILASRKAGSLGSLQLVRWTISPVIGVIVGVMLISYALTRFMARERRVKQVRMSQSVRVIVAGAATILVSVLWPGLLVQTREAWIMLVVTGGAALVLRYTVVGRRIYAVGGSVEAARLSGINITRYKIMPFIFIGVTAGIAGFFYASRFQAVDPVALSGEALPIIAACIVGGTSLFGGSGYVTKSVIGTLILASLTTGFGLVNLGGNYQYLAEGLVIIAAVTVYTVGGGKRKRRGHSLESLDGPPLDAAPPSLGDVIAG